MLASATAFPRITGTRPIDRPIVTPNPARRSAEIIVRRSDKRTRWVSSERRSLAPTQRTVMMWRVSSDPSHRALATTAQSLPLRLLASEVRCRASSMKSEEQEAARIERARGTSKEPEHIAVVYVRATSAKIIDDLPERDDRAAARDRRRRQRADGKPCVRRRAARKLHHRRRLIDAVDPEPMIGEVPRGRPTAASEFNDERTAAQGGREPAMPREKASDLGSGAACVLAEAGVVDVREIGSVDHSRYSHAPAIEPRTISTRPQITPTVITFDGKICITASPMLGHR